MFFLHIRLSFAVDCGEKAGLGYGYSNTDIKPDEHLSMFSSLPVELTQTSPQSVCFEGGAHTVRTIAYLFHKNNIASQYLCIYA